MAPHHKLRTSDFRQGLSQHVARNRTGQMSVSEVFTAGLVVCFTFSLPVLALCPLPSLWLCLAPPSWPSLCFLFEANEEAGAGL